MYFISSRLDTIDRDASHSVKLLVYVVVDYVIAPQ